MPVKRRSSEPHVYRVTSFICHGTPLLDAINTVYATVDRFGPKITGRGDAADEEAWSAVEEGCSRVRGEWAKLRDLLVGQPGVSADYLINFGRDLDKWLEHAENAAQANVEGLLAPADPTPLPNPGDLLRRAAMLEKHANPKKTPPAPWTPPNGYVGVKTIMNSPNFRKNGKNPPRETIRDWERSDKRKDQSVKRAQDPATHEVYFPESWVWDHISQWNPRN